MAVHNDFELEIIQPTDTLHITVSWIEVESVNGSFVVGPEHSELVSVLRPGGKLTYNTSAGRLVDMDISGGIFSVCKGRAVAVLDK
jgi:F0F1-type ATP synthase epsilon subunit